MRLIETEAFPAFYKGINCSRGASALARPSFYTSAQVQKYIRGFCFGRLVRVSQIRATMGKKRPPSPASVGSELVFWLKSSTSLEIEIPPLGMLRPGSREKNQDCSRKTGRRDSERRYGWSKMSSKKKAAPGAQRLPHSLNHPQNPNKWNPPEEYTD